MFGQAKRSTSILTASCRPKLPRAEWFDEAAGQSRGVPVGAALTVNGTVAYEAACLSGLRDGSLVKELPDYRPAPMPLAFVYPSRRHVPARTLAFMAGRRRCWGPG